MQEVSADYVVVGAGGTAMAFVDTMLEESDATFVLVDRRAKPGGHWNDAYPFIRLHVPASFYGVNSAPLGDSSFDSRGGNSGLGELSSGAEIAGYFDRVMERRFLDSGRVTFLPKHDYADGVATSLVTGRATRLTARRRIVDATHADTRVPATHPPAFPVEDRVTLVTPTGLVSLDRPAEGYVIIGGGKTAVDCALWLLLQGVDPEAIRWIRPRDSWFYNRRGLQPDPRVATSTVGLVADEMEAAAAATSLADLLRRLEARQALFRIDTSVVPAMFHCATVTESELVELRRIRNVVRLGRVRALERDRIRLDLGDIATSPRHVHIHCAASGVPVRPNAPVFRPDRILLQFVEHCWPLFSAALIGWLEARRDDDAERNRLATPIPMADHPADWLTCRLGDARNNAVWEEETDLKEWILQSRVNSFASLFAGAADPASPAHGEYQRLMRAADAGLARMAELHAAL